MSYLRYKRGYFLPGRKPVFPPTTYAETAGVADGYQHYGQGLCNTDGDKGPSTHLF